MQDSFSRYVELGLDVGQKERNENPEETDKQSELHGVENGLPVYFL